MKLFQIPMLFLLSCTSAPAPAPAKVDTVIVIPPDTPHDSVYWPKDSTQFIFDGPRFGFVYYPAKDSVEVWGRDTVGLVKHLVKQLYHCNEK